MDPRRGMGPNLALGKRPSQSATPRADVRRPSLLALSSRATINDAVDEADDDREGLLPWRYRA